MEKDEKKPMLGVVAYVNVTLGDAGIVVDASAAVANKMTALGGQAVQKLQRKVTHVVFQGGEGALVKLFERIDRCWKEDPGSRPSVVSTPWIEQVAETDDLTIDGFEIERPKEETFTARLLLSNTTAKTKKRKRASMITPASQASNQIQLSTSPHRICGTPASAGDETTRRLFLSPPHKAMKLSICSPPSGEKFCNSNASDLGGYQGTEAPAATPSKARSVEKPGSVHCFPQGRQQDGPEDGALVNVERAETTKETRKVEWIVID